MQELLDRIPGYAAALETERRNRDAAFLNETTVPVANVQCRLLTLRDLIILDQVGNPFAARGPVHPAHIAQFFWLLSPDYQPAGLIAWIQRWRLCRKLRKLPYGWTCQQIDQYLESQLCELPGGSSVALNVPSTSFAAVVVDILGKEYGWTDDYTMRLPLPRVAQQLRRITLRHQPKTVLFNPSDRIRSQWLAAQNPRNIDMTNAANESAKIEPI